MDQVEYEVQMEKIRSYERGYRAVHVMNLGIGVGFFQVLHQAVEGLTARELAFRLMLHEPYVKIWCQTAYHFELLDCDDQDRFKLQPHLAEIMGLERFPNQMTGPAGLSAVHP